MITIPSDSMTKAEMLLRKAKDNFVTMQSTLRIKAPTDLAQGSCTNAVFRELRMGSQAIKDALGWLAAESCFVRIRFTRAG